MRHFVRIEPLCGRSEPSQSSRAARRRLHTSSAPTCTSRAARSRPIGGERANSAEPNAVEWRRSTARARTFPYAQRVFSSPHPAGKVRTRDVAALALFQRLRRHRILGRSSAVAAVLPPGLSVDENSAGRGFFRFLDWQFTGSNDELTDPARYQYREAFLLVEAVFEGKSVNYCPYIFVDNDAAIARGWAQGFPKKHASVYQTRSFSAPSPAAAPLAKGSRFGASVAAHGERLATARIQLEQSVPDPSTVFNRPTTMRRYFPQLTAGRQDKPVVDELTMSLTDDLAIVDVWAGSAELKIPEVDGEDMHLLAPLRAGRGYRLGMADPVTDLRILKNYAG